MGTAAASGGLTTRASIPSREELFLRVFMVATEKNTKICLPLLGGFILPEKLPMHNIRGRYTAPTFRVCEKLGEYLTCFFPINLLHK